MIPVKWARVGAKRRWLSFYISYAAHMSQEKGKEIPVSIFSFLALSGGTILDSVSCGPSFRWIWAAIPLDVGQQYGDVGRCFGAAGQPGCPTGFGIKVLPDFLSAIAVPSVPSSIGAAPSSFLESPIPSLPRRCRRSIAGW